jgi:hypothetical protein
MVTRTIVPREPAYFLDSARRQAEALRANGTESAYDTIGLLEIENADLHVDPLPAMQALGFGPEDIADAIRESIEASERFGGQGPGSREAV